MGFSFSTLVITLVTLCYLKPNGVRHYYLALLINNFPVWKDSPLQRSVNVCNVPRTRNFASLHFTDSYRRLYSVT